MRPITMPRRDTASRAPRLAPAGPLPSLPARGRRNGLYEPKWDGFRAIAFVDGDESYLQSRNGRPLAATSRRSRSRAGRYVLDGELVILGAARAGRTSTPFRCACIRPNRACAGWPRRCPATFVAFDLLALDDEILLERPFEQRRAELEGLVEEPIALTPCTASEARRASG